MIHFASNLVMSAAGFVATIVLTRELGPERFGIYVVTLAVLSWLAIAGNFGLSQAVRKRVSESVEGNYVFAGSVLQVGLYLAVAAVIWLGRSVLDGFIGIRATRIILVMLAARLGLSFVRSVLQGQRLVHVSSLLASVEWTSRSVVQILLVLSGFGIAGAFGGYVFGALFAAVLGSYFVSVPRAMPSRAEFRRLRAYAQFSWLGEIKNRTFMSMDTIILALFVSKGLIAVYEVAWNLASLFAIFGVSISQTLFPDMSQLASEDPSDGRISELLRLSLAYSGLFLVPGLVGGAIVGDVVLSIYGSTFTTGYYVLLVLTFARFLYGYMSQLLNTINAVDRPDLTFVINVVFVGVNLVLNLLLTWRFGWYGAAVATTVSAGIGLSLGYHYAGQVVDVVVPVGEIAKQFAAAGVMAAVVLGGRLVAGDSLPVVISLVGVGAGVYLATLFYLSREFRTTVRANLPFELPTFASK